MIHKCTHSRTQYSFVWIVWIDGKVCGLRKTPQHRWWNIQFTHNIIMAVIYINFTVHTHTSSSTQYRYIKIAKMERFAVTSQIAHHLFCHVINILIQFFFLLLRLVCLQPMWICDCVWTYSKVGKVYIPKKVQQ